MIKQLTEADELKFQKLSAEDREKRGILGRLYGRCADVIRPTRNGRLYSEKLWTKVFESPLVKEQFEAGGIFGELTHPDYEEVAIEKIAIVMPEPPKKDKEGYLVGFWDILDTPSGRILKTLCDYGYKIGISTRGTGDLITGFDGQESVDPDTYTLNALDIVLVPACKEARLDYITESLSKTRYNKTLKQKLTESINKEDENNQRIMRESLHDIGIDLDESLFEESISESNYEPKFIDDMTIDELKAEEKGYYDAQYQYGRSLPMNRIWDIDYTIKELEKNSLNESLEVPELTNSINGVMGAYQNANKWLDSVKEFIYSDLSCPFFSSFVHELAHTMPGRFDKFGDILHTMDIEIPYPTTLELDNELTSIDDTFAIIFGCLDDIKNNLNNFIELTDKDFHGMACSAEELLNDIEQEYPMLYRMRDKWNQCNGDLVDFDKFVAQYVERKEDLLESLSYDEVKKNAIEAAKRDGYDQIITVDKDGNYGITRDYPNNNFEDFGETQVAKVKSSYKDGIQHIDIEESLGQSENILYKNIEIIENEDGTFSVTINDETQVFNSLKNAKTYIDMMQPHLKEELYVSAGKMNDELLGRAVKEFSDNAGDYGDALTFVKDKFSQYSLNDQKDIAKYINTQLSESLIEGVDMKTSIKRLGYKLVKSGEEIPGALYSDGSSAYIGDVVYCSSRDIFYTIGAANLEGTKVLVVDNAHMRNGNAIIINVGSPLWNEFKLNTRKSFYGTLTEEQIGRDTVEIDKSVDDVLNPDVEVKEEEDNKSTTIVLEGFLNEELSSIEEQAAEMALKEINLIEVPSREQVAREVKTACDEFEECDFTTVFSYVMNKLNEPTNEDLTVGDTEVDVDSLQEALHKAIELEKKVAILQEQLSASYARENKLEEDVNKYKHQIERLAQNTKEIEALTMKLEKANSHISEIENGIDTKSRKLQESIDNKNKVNSKLTESVRQRDSKIKSLQEQLDKVTEQDKIREDEMIKLQESYDSLSENYSDAQQNIAQLKSKYSKEIKQNSQLVEKYQRIAEMAVNKYIDTQAVRLGVTSTEIKNKLPKGYGFKDIDNICENLQEYKLNMSSLPFNTNVLNEGIGLKARNVRNELIPQNDDDEITDFDLKFANQAMR